MQNVDWNEVLKLFGPPVVAILVAGAAWLKAHTATKDVAALKLAASPKGVK